MKAFYEDFMMALKVLKTFCGTTKCEKKSKSFFSLRLECGRERLKAIIKGFQHLAALHKTLTVLRIIIKVFTLLLISIMYIRVIYENKRSEHSLFFTTNPRLRYCGELNSTRNW